MEALMAELLEKYIAGTWQSRLRGEKELRAQRFKTWKPCATCSLSNREKQ